MNTAQFSVQPNDLAAVSLTPLRRAAQRVRAACARLIERSMRWPLALIQRYCSRAADRIADRAAGMAAAEMAMADAEPRKRERTGALPGKRPFPPASASSARVSAAAVVVRGPLEGNPGTATAEPVSDQVGLKSMVLDVVLVLAWGAMIPAFMWLGVAGGF